MHNKKLIGLLSWLLFVMLVGVYCWIYAPYGLENNDGGFILGLAYQVFNGGSLYDQIIYVRPPISPILHSFIFYPPFSLAPIFSDRIFVYFQIAIYSTLSALLAKRLFQWETGYTAVVTALIFVFSAHSFPPMAWHTIDGIFFSVIALCLVVWGKNKNQILLFFSACSAILAAGSKQPFYIVPILILLLSMSNGKRMPKLALALASFIGASILFLIVLRQFGSDEVIWQEISSQTNLRDLLSVGVINYIRDFFHLRSIIATWPLMAALTIYVIRSQNNIIFLPYYLLASIWLLLLIIAQFYFTATGWAQPLSVFDSVYLITFLYSGVMVFKTRQESWLIISSMHVVGWAASISWGYLTTILYAAPSVITLAVILRPAVDKFLAVRALCVATLPAALLIFFMGNWFSYSLEGTVRRTSISADMGEISPSLRFIKAPIEQFELYRELIKILGRIESRPYVVLPNIPLAHMLTGTINPIGIDWPLNAEVGKNEKIIIERLTSSVDYAVVYKNANPKPEGQGKFGSATTVYISQNWKLTESSQNFSIFVNPRANFLHKIRGRCCHPTLIVDHY
jgi:hypothetical protein